MTKDEMITMMAKKSGITKKQATESLGVFMTTITTQLKKGKKVSFSGFGSFSVSKRKARPQSSNWRNYFHSSKKSSGI